MDKLEFENFDLEPEKEQTPEVNEDETASLSEEQCIDLSNKILIALETKVREHNNNLSDGVGGRVYLHQLKKVYVRGAEMKTRSPYEKDEKSNGVWAMARVNMFLRMKSGERPTFTGLASDKALPAKVSDFIDISASWLPSEKDFELAKKDIEIYDLYDFDSVNQLYLDEYRKVDFGWGW